MRSTTPSYNVQSGSCADKIRKSSKISTKRCTPYAEKLEFEKAGSTLKTIRHIEKTIEGQRVDIPQRADVDVIGIFREGDEVVVVLMFFRGGTLTNMRHYHFSNIAQEDAELLQTFLLQHYEQLDTLPHEILLPVDVAEAPTIAELLSSERSRKVSIHTPKRGNKRALIDMAQLNAESIFRKEKRCTRHPRKHPIGDARTAAPHPLPPPHRMF